MLTPCASVSRPNSLRRGLAGVSLLSLLLGVALAAEPPAGRVTETIEGIECQYSSGREELARLLVRRLVEHNQQAAAKVAAENSAPPSDVPLSAADMHARRATYLAAIAAQLGLQQPTAIQEECYDAFADNYEQTMRLYGMMREMAPGLLVIKRLTIWDREELVVRLNAGEKIAGFSYDPVTKQGHVSFGFSTDLQDDRLKELQDRRKQLHRQYSMSIGQENGHTVYRGRVSPIGAPPPPQPKDATAAAQPVNDSAGSSQWLPVIIPPDVKDLPAGELSQYLWDGAKDKGLAAQLGYIAKMLDGIPRLDPHLADIVLHETTEVGIIDRYFRGPDRRWFCDGVANYVPWRVVRDLHGADVATRVYNLQEALAQAAPLREKADLRKWPAVENESAEEQLSELDTARYAFAAQAVFLMNERGGANLLPRLFAEIGKTKPAKVSIKTVAKAWLKFTGTKLDTILAEAVKPLPVPAKPAG